ncbi:MAG TPA: methyltransferase domain-containing protein [Chloroflexota bacterium]|nr:methyltransferase domain-containing protein [Chloroflexota bacterium]
MSTDQGGADTSAERRDALVGRIFQSMLGAMDLFNLYLGDRLGLYRALAEGGPATSAELASRAGIAERYAREWLEQQAVGSILEVNDAGQEAAARRYSLPSGHDEVLLDQDSLSYLAYVGRFAVSIGQATPSVLEAFRTGGGVSWAAFGADAREGQAEQNRPIFLNLLGSAWLPAIEDVHARLQADPPTRVADIGCGAGWSCIGLAKAYPKARVDGFDLDEPSIILARSNAAEHGVADRVRFQVRDVSDPALAGQYDLVMGFEMLHDLSRPVEALRVMRGLLAAGGTVIIMDEKVAEQFTAPGDEAERLYYGFSTLCCLPAGMAEEPSAGTGAVMRPDTLRRYALEAGFRDVEVLPIEHDQFRFYRPIP